MATEKQQRLTLEKYINVLVYKKQGIRLGETTVISYRVHGNDAMTPGIIRIYTEQDAGKVYLKTEEENQFLHLDVFHEPACLDPAFVARRIREGIDKYFQQLRDLSYSPISRAQCLEMAIAMSKNIIVETSGGKGTSYDLAKRQGEFIPEKERTPHNHVHVLAQVDPQHFDSLLFMVSAIETAIQNQGFEIRRVEKINHIASEKTDTGTGIGISLPGLNTPSARKQVNEQNKLQTILDLAGLFGSVKEASKFLESLTPAGNMSLSKFAQKHGDGDLKQTLLDLDNKGLVKRGKIFKTLTEDGKGLLGFIQANQKELEAQVRKSIRRYKIVTHNYQTYYNSELKSKKKHLTDERKVLHLNDKAWFGNLAIAETVVHAASRSYLGGTRPMRIQKEDIHQYDEKSFAPIDTLLAIDCSGSMVGDKIRAVSYLAEHFLLTSHEKVAVVTFQENTSKVVVPFTKNYQSLQQGLLSIRPEGMTPLAKGIVESVVAIQKKRARNPLMILITDGIPNYPLWSIDAQVDALKAAKMIKDAKIRLVCIGVIPNEKFMAELAEVAGGNLYVVDQLDKNSLLDVVTTEWQRYKYAK